MRAYYRTKDRTSDYVFDFERHGQSWVVYIVAQPSYQTRGTGAVATHRLGLGSRPYICWDQPIPTLDQAKTIAASWAEGTQRYIATGRFPSDVVLDWGETAEIESRSRPAVGGRR